MPDAAYSEGNSLRTPLQFTVQNLHGGMVQELWKVPDGFFGRWRWIHWVATFNAANLAFRFWFINIVGPSGEECGQIIPGIAAVGGGGGVTTSPIHELLDSSLPVLTDEVFNGAAGVQPLWDYSGMTSLWFPNGFSFALDLSGLDPADSFTNIIGVYEIMLGEDSNLTGGENIPGVNALAFLLHQTG